MVGEWKYVEELEANFSAIHDGYAIICGLPNPDLYNPEEVEEMRTNAHLIVAAANNCRAVNPDNPRAVAESIKDMYEALQYLRGVFRDAKVQVLAEALPDQVAVESAFERVDAALAKVNWRSLG